jgi:uncharacterized protein (DUF486 family)
MTKAFYPIILLTISNVFMTFAWYGHLKHKNAALWLVVLVSWGIAFFEYCFQVPANRIGHGFFSAAQLKVMQEIITLIVFVVFSALYLKEGVKWNYLVGFFFIVLAAGFNGQQHPRFDQQQRSCHRVKLRNFVKVKRGGGGQVIQVLLGYLGYGNVVNVNLVFFD